MYGPPSEDSEKCNEKIRAINRNASLTQSLNYANISDPEPINAGSLAPTHRKEGYTQTMKIILPHRAGHGA